MHSGATRLARPTLALRRSAKARLTVGQVGRCGGAARGYSRRAAGEDVREWCAGNHSRWQDRIRRGLISPCYHTLPALDNFLCGGVSGGRTRQRHHRIKNMVTDSGARIQRGNQTSPYTILPPRMLPAHHSRTSSPAARSRISSRSTTASPNCRPSTSLWRFSSAPP